MLPATLANRRAFLVVAHPGHELRVHGWLEEARPSVWVITDGSGHGDTGRVQSTAQLLARAGCAPGAIFGRLSDRVAYEMIMGCDAGAVAALVDELAEAMCAQRTEYVAGDACEGFNPVHDLCRLITDTATLVAERRQARAIDSFEFPLEAGPGWRGGGEELCWLLDDDALARKLAAARQYAELADEVERTLRAYGADAFRTERLHRVTPLRTLGGRFDGKPQYERFGEERVAAGHYHRVLRHDQHFAPLATALLALCELT